MCVLELCLFVMHSNDLRFFTGTLDVDNGGTPILNFELEARNSATPASPFVKISSWDGISQAHVLDVLVDT